MKGRYLDIRDNAAGARVVLAMSGGVDSAVAAVMLRDAGYEVIGLTMKNYCYGEEPVPDKSCCSLEAIDDARESCDRIGIRHMVVSTEEIFGREVYDNFLDEYRAGRTPNPCVRCNSIVRFDTLEHYAAQLDADYIATGHYARVFRADNGRLYLARARSEKDQSYFLSGLNHDDLGRVLFPLAGADKPEVRDSARAAGLDVAEKPESMEVCFIPEGTLRNFLDGKVPMKRGEIQNTDGDVLGHHPGTAAYTIGQRRGLGVSVGRPVYVVEIDVERNVVVVGDDPDLERRELMCRLGWIDDACRAGSLSVDAQIRSRHAAQPVERIDVDGGKARVVFSDVQRAVAPGQTIAFYDGDLVVGAGVIESAAPR